MPVVAEPTAACWPDAVRTGPWLLGMPALRPAQVVVAGRPTLHRPVQRLLADPEVAVYALADPDRPGLARRRRHGARGRVVAGAAARPGLAWSGGGGPTPPPGAALDRALDEPAAPGRAAAGPGRGRRAARRRAAGAGLVQPGARRVAGRGAPAGPAVLANRGVAGIDGTVSTALGAALAHPGPGYALLGDLTLLHDTTGLVLGPDEPRPDLTLVVLNDRGGGHLQPAGAGRARARGARSSGCSAPRTGSQLAALCAALGVRAPARSSVTDGPALAAALAPQPGLRLVEVPADRATLRAGHARLRDVVRAAVEALLTE